MRVTADEKGIGAPTDAPIPFAPRIYALDMVLPDKDSTDTGPLAVDINGARASMDTQRLLYGDDRVHESVMKVLAEAGNGVVTSVSQITTAPAQDRLSATRLRAIGGRASGWYEAASAYVPIGDPHSRAREQTPKTVADKLGIDFRSAEVYWEGDRFLVREPGATPMELRRWRPEGVLWPYAWDQRTVALPPRTPVCNPLPYAMPTTNKLLAACLLGGQGVPPSYPSGLWRHNSGRLAAVQTALSSSPLSVVKPLVGRRGFGVVVVPTEHFSAIAPQLGLVATTQQLARTAELTIIGFMWGQATELLALAQPYVPPIQRIHPDTGRPHTAMVRATVVVDKRGVRCVDACAQLAPQPSDGPTRQRDALLLTPSDSPAVLELADDEQIEVRDAAEQVIRHLEHAVRAQLERPKPLDTVRAEIDVLVGALDASTDGPVAVAWEHHRDTITGYEALNPNYVDEDGSE